MFKCLKCGNLTALPKCTSCGYEFDIKNGVYQLTNTPNMNLDDNKGIKYIGYDNIGHYYSEKNWIECSPRCIKIGEQIAELTGDGIFLDLACGNGDYSVPAALNGCSVICGDISNTMLELLLKKAVYNHVDSKLLTVCRMNALSIPLPDNSMDTAMINSALHLFSAPEKVIDELYRVLKPGGKLLLGVNSPGLSKKVTDELSELNKNYFTITNDFYKSYWGKLNAKGIHPSKYSWKFDQFTACKEKFGNISEIKIDFYEKKTQKMCDSFLYRMGGKGFSDQQNIDDNLHKEIFEQVLSEFQNKYGVNFVDTTFINITDGLTLSVFQKLL